MLTLNVFSPQWGLPNAAPFCLKTEAMLRLAEVPYKTKHAMPNAGPKGKLPALQTPDGLIGDSEFIGAYLKAQHGFDLDAELTPAERAESLAFRVLAEDHLYFASLYFRWVESPALTRETFFDDVPAPLRRLVFALIRKKIVRALDGQGMGRHTPDEVAQLGGRALDALAARLSGDAFFHGKKLSYVDVAVYPQLAGLFAGPFDTSLEAHARRHPHLVDYCAHVERAAFGAVSPGMARVQATWPKTPVARLVA